MSGLNSVLKLEMTSYSDSAYEITNLFCCFKKFLVYTLFLPSFIVVRHQMVELNWGGGLLAPPVVHKRGIPDPVQNRVKVVLRHNPRKVTSPSLEKRPNRKRLFLKIFWNNDNNK